MLLEKILHLDEEYKKEIVRLQCASFPVILFGAGSTSDFIVEQFNHMDIYPAAFCDNDSKKVRTIVSGLPVMDIKDIMKKYPDAYFYITTQLYYSVIKQQLISEGIKADRISEYELVVQLKWEREYISYCQDHEQELEAFYKLLADDESRHVLYNKLAFYRTRNRKYMTEIRGKCQYFDEKIINFSQIKSFIDLGMYTGDTILEFSKHVMNECEIWGFEPDESIASKAEKALQKVENVHIVRKATSNKDGKIPVKNSLGIMQTVAEGMWDANSLEEVFFEVCSLDQFFFQRTKAFDFIKMDIEGAEFETLLGARNVIEKDMPILAICVYHKKEDLFTIPQYILQINENYQMYLRHYSDNSTETVCYAVPGRLV